MIKNKKDMHKNIATSIEKLKEEIDFFKRNSERTAIETRYINDYEKLVRELEIVCDMHLEHINNKVSGREVIVVANGDSSAKVLSNEDYFNMFWKEYPRKVNKSNAKKAFAKIKKMNDKLFNDILVAVKMQKQTVNWLKDGGTFIPHASTWLNGQRWEDEIGEIGSEKGGSGKFETATNNLRKWVEGKK